MSITNESKISLDQKIKCNAIIHGASIAAGGVGAGMAQLPAADNMIITPIQIGMIVSLGGVFDIAISKSAARAILSSVAASIAGRSVSQALVGWIPLIGNGINATTAATITETIGWMAVDIFAKDAYNDIIKENPSYKKDTETEGKHEDNQKEPEKKELLKAKAEEFFSGKKNRKDNFEEYNKLLNEYDKVMDYEDDSLRDYYSRLVDLGLKSAFYN